jgi:hypothetical protein
VTPDGAGPIADDDVFVISNAVRWQEASFAPVELSNVRCPLTGGKTRR